MRWFLLHIVFVSCAGFSQTWNLQQCLDTGLVKNYNLTSSDITSAILNENLKESKATFLPSLNGGAIHGYNWGQTLDPFTNQFATDQVQYNNFYLRSGVVLFSGMGNYYNVRMRETDLESEVFNRKIQERGLKIEIATSYLQILLNNEVLQIAIEHLGLSLKQREKLELLIAAEKETNYKFHEINAQVQRDQLTILTAQNDLNFSLLVLQQLIDLPYDSSFTIETADTLFKEVSLNAEEIDPRNFAELRAADLNFKYLYQNDKYIRSNLYPTLSLNGAIGTGYSGNNTELIGGSDVTKPFGIQLSENFYQSVYFSLNIPIFNRRNITTQIKTNDLQIKQLVLDKEQAKLTVEKMFEQLKMVNSNSKRQYQMSQAVLNAVKLNYQESQIRYENGKLSYGELLEIKDALFIAQSDLIQAKYQSYINELILKFYLEN
ncbi:MAG: outer membrane protein [Crocinitomix sp.]|jgi:outer membrane protein